MVDVRRFLAAFLLLFLGTALAAELPKKTHAIEGVTEWQLPNGLKLLTLPDPGADTITVHIVYLVGSRHEGYGEKGMAHLLEHLLFKGSKRHPEPQGGVHAPRRALERHHLERPHQLLRDLRGDRRKPRLGDRAWRPTAWSTPSSRSRTWTAR